MPSPFDQTGQTVGTQYNVGGYSTPSRTVGIQSPSQRREQGHRDSLADYFAEVANELEGLGAKLDEAEERIRAGELLPFSGTYLEFSMDNVRSVLIKVSNIDLAEIAYRAAALDNELAK